MKRVILFAALLVAGLGFAACSDDDSSGNNNQQIDADASVQEDATAEVDGSNEPWNCSEIGACAQECESEMACVQACKAKGCDSAQEAFGDLMTCVMQNCLTPCGNEGSEEECNTCMAEHCSDQQTACTSNTCP